MFTMAALTLILQVSGATSLKLYILLAGLLLWWSERDKQ
jgi:hypothetical protein